jgi:hypothetical protein
MAMQFDRASENVGNLLALEHLNLTVPDHSIAMLFYVSALGLTRDPYMDFGVLNFNNMWVNIGEQQFHLPEGRPQRLRGHVGIVVPDLDELRWRLDRVGKSLKDTEFGWEVYDDYIGVTCPWGNALRCHAADASMSLGIRYIEMDTEPDTADGLARFYRDVFASPGHADAGVAEVRIGVNQTLRFVEKDAPPEPYDGHHIAVYVVNFSTAHDWLATRSLISEESDQHQYRFQALVDPEDGRPLAELEHEVRSLHHPQYNRHLVNRNASHNFFTFNRYREAFVP